MIAGIVLAAGMSTRMGSFKQLLPLQGRRVVQVVVERIVPRVERVYVVVGHRASEVEAALVDYPVECVYNPDYDRGMLSSVQAGVRAAGCAGGYLICLGDQPGIPVTAVEKVVAAARSSKAGIVIPVHGGHRGHPVYLRRKYREEILNLPEERGLNEVTRGHPEDTLEVPVDDVWILKDMDTPEEYRQMRAGLRNDRS